MPNDPLLTLLDSGQVTVIRMKRRPYYRTSEIEAMVAEGRRMLAENEDG